MAGNRKINRNRPIRKNGRANVIERTKHALKIIAPAILIISGVSLLALRAKSAFPLNKFVFTGNVRLSDDELKSLSGVKEGESLLSVSGRRVYEKLAASPWIKSVSVRKEFPDGLHILIRESEPFALLDMNGRLFIVDEQGKMLEQLIDSPIPFLPIISGNPFTEKVAFGEAVRLAGAIREAGLLSRKDHIEIIAHKPEELAVNFDGVVVKIGAGEYKEKLARLIDLEGEIRKRQIAVDYIDLRFENKVIVKPVAEVLH